MEKLNERMSDIVYHYTDLASLEKIVESDSLIVNDESWNKMGYISFARNKNANIGFPKGGGFNVRITFDGVKLNSRFKGYPYDWAYHGQGLYRLGTKEAYRLTGQDPHTEMEDRLEVPIDDDNPSTKYSGYNKNGDMAITNVSQYITRVDIFLEMIDYHKAALMKLEAILNTVLKDGWGDITHIYTTVKDFNFQSSNYITVNEFFKKFKITEDKHPRIIKEIKCTKEDIISGRWRTMLAEKYYKSPQPEVSQENGPNPQVNNGDCNYTQCPLPSSPDSNKTMRRDDGTEVKVPLWRTSQTRDSESKYLDKDGVRGKYRYADHWHAFKIKNFVPHQCPQFKNPKNISFTIVIIQSTNIEYVNNLVPSDEDWRKFLELFNNYETELLWNNGATIDMRKNYITLKILKNYDPGDSVPRQKFYNLLKKWRCGVLS